MKKAAPIFLTLVLLAVTQLAAEAKGHHYGWNQCRNGGGWGGGGWGGGCRNNWNNGWNRGGWGSAWNSGWRNPQYGNWGTRYSASRHRGWW
jgi:hypothetical protein